MAGANDRRGACIEDGVVERRLLALATACAAHVAALGALGAVSLPLGAPATFEPSATEIDLAPIELRQAIAAAPPAATLGKAVAFLDRAARASGGAIREQEKSVWTPEEANSAPNLGPNSEPSSNGWSFSPSTTRMELGAALSPDLVAPEPASGKGHRPDASPRSTTGGVSEALAAHDVELGIGRGGAILSAAEQAARGGDAPVSGSATFDVAVHADGAVLAEVVSTDGNRDAWARVAEDLQRSVDPARIRLPPGGRGWRVVVQLDAHEQFADGRDVRSLHGPRVSLAPSALSAAMEGKEDAGVSSAGPGGPDHVPGDAHDPPHVGGALGGKTPVNAGAGIAQALAARILPTPTVSVSGNICSASLTLTPMGVGLGGGCSLENSGTGTSRVVHGRILREGAL